MARDEIAFLIRQTASNALSQVAKQTLNAKEGVIGVGNVLASRTPQVGAAIISQASDARVAASTRLIELGATAVSCISRTGSAICSRLPRISRPARNTAIAVIAIGATVGAATVLIARHFDPHVRLRTQSGPTFVITERTATGYPVRVMVAGNVYQSATYLDERWNELPFEYYRAFDHMFEAPLVIERVLMMGGGGFAYPKHLLTTRSEVSMDVVESDLKVIQLALDYFYLDKLMETCGDRLRVHEQDGLSYLQTTECTYDVIINDAFLGAEPDPDLASLAGAQLAHARLNPGGLYLTNVVAYPSKDGAYEKLAQFTATLEQAFKHVWIVASTDEEFSEEENYLVIASDAEYAFSEDIPY